MIGLLRRLFGRERLEGELDRELAFHVEAQAADLVRAGVPIDEARRRARVMLGGVEQVKEDARDARGTRWLEDWLRDTRQALLGMKRSPGFTAAAVLTLAFGIGATTAVWSIVDALMLRALPVAAPEEIYAVRKVGHEDDSYLMSWTRYQRLRSALPDPTSLGAMSSQATMYATLGERPEPVAVQLVSDNWFTALGVGATVGRPIGPQDFVTIGAHPVMVVSESFWRTRLDADPAAIGRTIRVNGTELSVVGVIEPGFAGLTVGAPVDIWIPASMQHEVRFLGNSYTSDANSGQPWMPQYGVHWLTMVGRFEPARVAEAEARLNAQFRREVEEEFSQGSTMPAAAREARMRERVAVESLSRGFSGLRSTFEDPLKLLFLSCATILLIACGNLAGLLLARSAARTHEIAVRVSLGARPGRLIRQTLSESMTLALAGGALSLVVAYWGSRALLRMASSGSTAVPLDVSIDGRMLAFALGTTLLAGLAFGLVPAIRVGRTNLFDGFRTGNRAIGRAGSHRVPLGRVLLVGQIALSLVLVTSAGLFVRSFQNALAIDPGFDPDAAVVARVDVLAAGYTVEQLPALYDRMTGAARSVPGVRSVGLSWLTIGTGGRSVGGFTIPGREFTAGGNTGQVNFATPGFFGTVGLPILRGRDFTEADREGAPLVAVVSERTAREFFGTLDVIGRRFGYGTPPEFEIVGVVRDARVNSIKEIPQRLVFFPLAQGMRHVTNVAVRTNSPESVAPALHRAIQAVDARLPVRDALTIDALHERGLSRERLVARIAGALGFLSLLLVGIGLYGVIAYSVSRRTNEMGVRMALGASTRTVSWLVLRDSLAIIGMGIAIGAALALPALRLTRRLVYGIEPHDPIMLASAVAVLVAVGVVAALLPAWRASRIDPISAIRIEG